MKHILPWLYLPLCMMAVVFGLECLVNGVDLSIEREGDKVRVFVTNNTYRCAMFQWNAGVETNGWNDYHGYFAGMSEQPVKRINFEVKANNERAFWRLRDCANP
jgi:hypothetical protein